MNQVTNVVQAQLLLHVEEFYKDDILIFDWISKKASYFENAFRGNYIGRASVKSLLIEQVLHKICQMDRKVIFESQKLL